ncbi:hypothetical protein F7725_021784 [Dissostichus mawsoni]|uniref:Uncharacterized protein n=1 Tax=Dissostichus mawsoni TaxID=36200 RepID=A0A7J5ZC71_DISMA|nr:hypothetical protein F7725_021784 [Dissostichus mawsoni]
MRFEKERQKSKQTPLARLAEVIPCDRSAHVVMLWAGLSLILQNRLTLVQLWTPGPPACWAWPGPAQLGPQHGTTFTAHQRCVFLRLYIHSQE